MQRISRLFVLILLVSVSYIRVASAAWNGVPLGTASKMGLKGGSRSQGADGDELSSPVQSRSSASRKEREQLYEAYNHLHTLAQDFHKPFDAPAVIVVGHQTSGKSALIEALMGFQFNQVCIL